MKSNRHDWGRIFLNRSLFRHRIASPLCPYSSQGFRVFSNAFSKFSVCCLLSCQCRRDPGVADSGLPPRPAVDSKATSETRVTIMYPHDRRRKYLRPCLSSVPGEGEVFEPWGRIARTRALFARRRTIRGPCRRTKWRLNPEARRQSSLWRRQIISRQFVERQKL